MATYARRLAGGGTERDAAAIRRFAEELDAKAAALEIPPQTFSHSDVVAVQQAEEDADLDKPGRAPDGE